METPKINHLLQKHGILKTFHISRVVNKKDVSDVYKKLNLDEKTASDDLKNKINKSLYILTQGNFANEQIPGVISETPIPTPTLLAHDTQERKLYDLLDISQLISEIMLSEGLSLRECSFVMDTVIKNLNLRAPDDDSDMLDE